MILMSLKSLHFEQYDGEAIQNRHFLRYYVIQFIERYIYIYKKLFFFEKTLFEKLKKKKKYIYIARYINIY